RPYSEIAAVELPAAPAPLVALPEGRVVELQPPSEQSSLRYVEVAHAEGFPRPAHLPLLIAVDDARLLGFALEPLPADVSEHRFAVDLRTAPVGPVLVCGDVLAVVERDRARGIDLESGAERWRHEPPPGRDLENLGVRHGVLHLYSA